MLAWPHRWCPCRLPLLPAGCYALARLLDEGVVAGCEGDVCTTLGMLWGRLMTGCVPWMGNVAQVPWDLEGILKESTGVHRYLACHVAAVLSTRTIGAAVCAAG